MFKIFLENRLKSALIVFLFLLSIVCLAFFLRTYFCYNIIFSGGVVKYGDDAMYHMRLLENMLLGGHFPSFAYFDPYLNFPHGSFNGIAPLYDFILALFIWVITFGKPTIEAINKIAPFYPAVLGSLIPVVIYFIAKALWNNAKVSLACAFLVSTIPPILYKSLLGANDHHVAEVLLSSTTLMFLLFALKSAKNGTSFKNKKLWIFIILCGFSLGLYFLTWVGAILFLFLIFAFLALYYLMEFISARPSDWILIAGSLIFLIAFLMILPFTGHPDLNSGMYGINHLISFGLGLFGFLAAWLLSVLIKKKSLKRWTIIPFFLLSLLILLLVLKIFTPYIFEKTLVLVSGINNNGISSINFKNFIAEMRPLEFQGAVDDFSSLFFLFLLGFCIVFYNYFKERKPEYLLLIIWSSVAFLITGIITFFGQGRFDIYFSVCVALLAGFIIVRGIEFGWKSLNISSRLDESNSFKIYFLVGSLAILSGLVFLMIYPFPFNAGLSGNETLPDIVQNTLSKVGRPYSLGQDWYVALRWLKEKTPDPGLGFYDLYREPGINKKTGEANLYQYPASAYGVLSWWDFGYAILYYAHRMPIADPGQRGIGRIENGQVKEVGAGVFLLETDEAKAVSYLDELKAKYILTDSNFSIMESGLFNVMVKWVQGNMDGYLDSPEDSLTKYDNAMMVRLHLLDGSETTIVKKVSNNKNIDLDVGALTHFRLLYESPTTARLLPVKDSTRDLKRVKVFEYVKGAKIRGRAVSGTKIEISTQISTNQQRNFAYQNSIVSEDGNFEFVVPYSTGKQENSDVSAGEYTIKIGSRTKNIKVSEDDILQGKIVQVNF